MELFQSYLTRHNVPLRMVTNWHKNVAMCIVVPCYNEPDIDHTIRSVLDCRAINVHVELIVLINSGETSSLTVLENNRATYNALLKNYPFNPKNRINVTPFIVEGIRKKHAGAGYARKMGMDLAVSTFYAVKNLKGMIVSLDADTLVSENYLARLEEIYLNEEIDGGTIYFEHPLNQGTALQSKGIALYELHLRYFRHALKYIGFPYDYYTIGSAFFIRVGSYVKQGGMNRKQGGEDFYFLHKVLPNIRHCELREASVFPSPRISDRVPFGTGPRLKNFIETEKLLSYSFGSFGSLKIFYNGLNQFYENGTLNVERLLALVDEPLRLFLYNFGSVSKIDSILKNTSNKETFLKRCLSVFDAFFIVKYLNSVHTGNYKMVPVEEEALLFLNAVYGKSTDDAVEALHFLRAMDKKVL